MGVIQNKIDIESLRSSGGGGGGGTSQLIYKNELTKVGRYFDKDLYSYAVKFDSEDAVRSIDLSSFNIDEFVNMTIIGAYPTGQNQIFDLSTIADRNNTYAFYDTLNKRIDINSTFYALSFNALFTINEE